MHTSAAWLHVNVVWHTKCHHGLRSSASSVWTATGLVNARWQFSTPYRIDTPKITKKIVTGDLRQWPLQLCQIWCTPALGGLLGEWVKYTGNLNYFYLYPFFANSPKGQTRRRIFAHDGSNDADSCKDVPFLGFIDIAPHLGGKIPPKPQILGRE